MLAHKDLTDDADRSQDGDVLRALSTSPDDLPVKRQSEYPGTLSHVEEATALISQSSTDGPKDWLKTFSRSVSMVPVSFTRH